MKSDKVMKLIDKDALVAEIKRRKELVSDPILLGNDLMIGERNAYFNLLSFLDTLEVKEVDLKKELESWRHNHFHGRRDKEASGEYLERVSQLELAKHFFELGLSSQLSWKDIELIAEIGMDFMNSEDSDNLNDEEYYTEILNRFKAQKGEGPVSEVWHKKDEEPCEDRQVLVCLSGNYYIDFYHKKDKRFYMCFNPHHYLCEVDRWAYIDDIVKNLGDRIDTNKFIEDFKHYMEGE